jgi:hypothetical protein
MALVALLGGSATAHATTGLVWQWPEEGRQYSIQAEVHVAEAFWMRSEFNLDIRVTEFRFFAVTTCKPAANIGKSAWELQCTLDDVAVSAAPASANEAQREALQGVLDEWDKKYTGAFVQMSFKNDGRVRQLDLEGVKKGNRRLNEIHEAMRLVAARGFSGFDLQLPKKGDDKGKGQWKQNSPLTMKFPSDKGTMGSADVVYEVESEKAGLVKIVSSGRGTLGSGEMIVVGDVEQPKNLYKMTLGGQAVFDTTSGLLKVHEFMTEGTPTASSELGDGFAPLKYVQALRLAEVSGVAPSVGESEAYLTE